jgi:hypothetical protein
MAKRWESRREFEDRQPNAAIVEASDDALGDANAKDESLRKTAQTLLRESPFAELHALDVVIEDHALKLRGQVMSYFHKQIAQETVRSVAPAGMVENDLVVHPGHRLH